jgi:hypothetical protein
VLPAVSHQNANLHQSLTYGILSLASAVASAWMASLILFPANGIEPVIPKSDRLKIAMASIMRKH